MQLHGQKFHFFHGFHTFHYDLWLNLTINPMKIRNFNPYFRRIAYLKKQNAEHI